MLYTQDQTDLLQQQTFRFLKVAHQEQVFTITLNRPEKKNALNQIMTRELAFALYCAKHRKEVWAVVLQAEGNVFCAGADLTGFADEDSGSTIPEPNGDILITSLFHELHKPCIARVKGDVYAGGMLLLAGCTHVLAADHIQLSLPETKRGLFPFQVMASLLEIMPTRKVLDWCIQGYPLTAAQALEWGLLSQVCPAEHLEQELQKLLTGILACSPAAIRLGLEAYAQIRKGADQTDYHYLMDMFVKSFQTRDAQEGILAFREKRNPAWTGE